jgi:hypothetical protein
MTDMDVKEYTCVKKNDEILFQSHRFIEQEKIMMFLKRKKIKGRFQIEYSFIENSEHILYAIIFFKNYSRVGMVFPCASYQSNKK